MYDQNLLMCLLLLFFFLIPGPKESSRTHHAARKADTTQARADVVPHPDAAPANALSHGQLQEEERDSDEYQQDEIRDQVRACKELTRASGEVPAGESVSSHHITSLPGNRPLVNGETTATSACLCNTRLLSPLRQLYQPGRVERSAII